MIEELACVRLKRSIAPYPIPVGTTGAVVMVHDAEPPAFEVEFFDDENNTLEDPRTGDCTFTLTEEDLEVIP